MSSIILLSGSQRMAKANAARKQSMMPSAGTQAAIGYQGKRFASHLPPRRNRPMHSQAHIQAALQAHSPRALQHRPRRPFLPLHPACQCTGHLCLQDHLKAHLQVRQAATAWPNRPATPLPKGSKMAMVNHQDHRQALLPARTDTDNSRPCRCRCKCRCRDIRRASHLDRHPRGFRLRVHHRGCKWGMEGISNRLRLRHCGWVSMGNRGNSSAVACI